MPRTLPRALASVVEDLELDQPTLVTMATLRELVDRHGIGTAPKVVAARLRAIGWFLDTGTRGVWEFAPAAHAGPIGHADPALPLAAALEADPSLPAALALTSAAWAHGYADRTPGRLDVALPRGAHVPAGLARSAQVTTFDPRLAPRELKGVPVHQPASILTHLATSAMAVRSWTTVVEWLPDLAADLDAASLATELADRTTATRVRAGYLLSGLRPDLAELVRPDVGGVVRLGERSSPVRRHNSMWRVLDSLLPSDPTTWAPVT